jgi:5-methylcytosine-specific restriction endonuclease McrA
MVKGYEYARGHLRAHLFENLGRVIGSDELRDVAGISTWEHRIRELRDKEGYQILTHNDRSSRKPGEYLLETDKPQPAFARDISKETRIFVLNYDKFSCYMCGGVAGENDPYDPTQKTRLHIGHIIDKTMGGTDEPSNLRAICSVCNEGASNITLPRPDLQKLLIQVRRATNGDQLEVLKWLINKFPEQSKEFTKSAVKPLPCKGDRAGVKGDRAGSRLEKGGRFFIAKAPGARALAVRGFCWYPQPAGAQAAGRRGYAYLHGHPKRRDPQRAGAG